MSKRIPDEMVKEALDRMYVERELFGRFLYSWESEPFWKAQKPKRMLVQRLLNVLRRIWKGKHAKNTIQTKTL